MFPRRLLRALYSPDSYALVLLLILVTYALSTALTAAWATSLIVAVQIGVVPGIPTRGHQAGSLTLPRASPFPGRLTTGHNSLSC